MGINVLLMPVVADIGHRDETEALNIVGCLDLPNLPDLRVILVRVNMQELLEDWSGARDGVCLSLITGNGDEDIGTPCLNLQLDALPGDEGARPLTAHSLGENLVEDIGIKPLHSGSSLRGGGCQRRRISHRKADGSVPCRL